MGWRALPSGAVLPSISNIPAIPSLSIHSLPLMVVGSGVCFFMWWALTVGTCSLGHLDILLLKLGQDDDMNIRACPFSSCLTAFLLSALFLLLHLYHL